MFLNVGNQVFHITHVHIFENAKGVLMWNLRHNFSYKVEDIEDFQICISVPLTQKSICSYYTSFFFLSSLLVPFLDGLAKVL